MDRKINVKFSIATGVLIAIVLALGIAIGFGMGYMVRDPHDNVATCGIVRGPKVRQDSVPSSAPVRSTSPVAIRETPTLRFYFPDYSNIDLVCGKMPDKRIDKDVILTCAAAYTVKRLNTFDHTNIIGNHVSGGKQYAGTPSDSYRGAFFFFDGKPHFVYKDWSLELREAADKGGCGFAQDMMIHDGKITGYSRSPKSKSVFRALCKVDGRLAVIDSRKEIEFAKFVEELLRSDVREAIYLDMGGWKHSWYRDSTLNAIDIYPNPNRYGTNWITFYR